MSRWAIFPPDADRPWRAVFVLVDHGVRTRVASRGFLFLLVLVSVVSAAAGLWGAQPKKELVLVVEDPNVRAHYERVAPSYGIAVIEAEPRAVPEGTRLVHLRGEDPIHPTLHAGPSSASEQASMNRAMNFVVRDVRVDILLPDLKAGAADLLDAPPKRPAATAPATADDRLGLARARAAVGMMGLFYSMVVGSGVVSALRRNFDAEWLSIARVGTPDAALWLGEVLRRTAVITVFITLATIGGCALFLAGAAWLDWNTSFAVLLTVATLALAFFGPLFPWATLMAAGLLVSVERRTPVQLPAWTSEGLVWLGALFAGVAVLLHTDPSSALRWLPAPGLGLPATILAVGLGASRWCLLPAILVQAIWTVVALIAGAKAVTARQHDAETLHHPTPAVGGP